MERRRQGEMEGTRSTVPPAEICSVPGAAQYSPAAGPVTTALCTTHISSLALGFWRTVSLSRSLAFPLIHPARRTPEKIDTLLLVSHICVLFCCGARRAAHKPVSLAVSGASGGDRCKLWFDARPLGSPGVCHARAFVHRPSLVVT